MAGQSAGVSPPQHPTLDCHRDEKAIPGSPTRIRLNTLGRRLNSPGDYTHHPGWRKDGVPDWTVVRSFSQEETKQGVSPDILGARAVGEGEVESAEEQSPARLPWAESLGVPDVC